MAKFTLTIETTDASELADLTDAMARVAPAPEVEDDAPLARPAQEKPKATKGKKADAPAAEPSEAAPAPKILVPSSEQATTSTPSTATASPSEVTIADCKAALNAAMERGLAPLDAQQIMLEGFGAGAISKIDPTKYAALKALLDQKP